MMTAPLTQAERERLSMQLAEAERALHELMIGNVSVSVAYEGESVTFRQTDEAKLRRYIDELKAALGLIRQARRRGVSA